jgi:hypothetical protein
MYFCACSVQVNQQRLLSDRSCKKIGNEFRCGNRSSLRELDILSVDVVFTFAFAFEVEFNFFFDDVERVFRFLLRLD